MVERDTHADTLRAAMDRLQRGLFRRRVGLIRVMQMSWHDFVPNSIASVVIDHGIARRIAQYGSIILDLGAAQTAATRLAQLLKVQGNRDPMLTESFTFHIVVRYASCFGVGDGRKTKLERLHVERLERPDLLELHSGLIDRRHQTFAHAGTLCTQELVLHLLPGDRLTYAPWIEGPGPICDYEQAELIAELCQKVIPVVDDMAKKYVPALEALIEERKVEFLGHLKEQAGRHAVPEQAALALLQSLPHDAR